MSKNNVLTGFLDYDRNNPHAWEAFKEITMPLQLNRFIHLTFSGIYNAARSEEHFKTSRKAESIDMKSCTPAYREAGEAFHRRSLDQFAAASEAVYDSICLSEAADEDVVKKLDEFYHADYASFMKQEIVPDLKLRLLESELAPVEAQIVYNNLVEMPSSRTSVKKELEVIHESLKELHKLRSQSDRGVNPEQDEGDNVPKWKKVATKLGVQIIKILIAICKKIFRIICEIIEWIWKLIEKEVIEYVYKKCSDPKPTP